MTNSELQENAMELLENLGEVAVDSLMNDGLLKDIPIVGTVINIAKISQNVRDQLFLRKLSAFFYGMEKLSSEDKEKIQKKISAYEDKTSLGEEIMKVIDDSENSKKAKLLGHAMQILLKGDISVDFYLGLSHKITQCYYNDLQRLKEFKDEEAEYYSGNDVISGLSLDQLYFCGFLQETGYSGGNADGTEPCGRSYQLNDNGIIVRSLLLSI